MCLEQCAVRVPWGEDCFLQEKEQHHERRK